MPLLPNGYLVTNQASASVAIATLLPSYCQHHGGITAHEAR